MGRLAGKTAIITGGNAGIGRGIAQAFAQEGANLCICARRAELLAAAADELRALGATVVAPTCDITSEEDLRRVVQVAVETFGGIDILVNNAAYISPGAPFEALPLADWQASLRGGAEAAFLLMQMCFPYLKATRGNVINMTSSASTRGAADAGYAATKGATEAMSRVAAFQWFQHGITVNCIAPSAWSEGWERALAGTGISREEAPKLIGGGPRVQGWYVGDPLHDVGPAAVYLASQESKYVTGQVMYVDGGQNGLGI